jgi:hypothetical protein
LVSSQEAWSRGVFECCRAHITFGSPSQGLQTCPHTFAIIGYATTIHTLDEVGSMLFTGSSDSAAEVVLC